MIKKYSPINKIALVAAGMLALMSARSHAQGTSSIILTSGSLAIPDGDLVQVLGDTTSTFGAPTPTSFEGTDPNEVLLASFAMNDTDTGIPGVFQGTITFNLGTGAGEIPAGSFLLLRWYPTLTTAATVPGANTPYGQFSSSTQEYPGDPNPQTTIPWTVPSFGEFNYDVWFLTANEDSNGPSAPVNPPANSAGLANYTVAVPEPTTLSLMAGAFGIGAMALRRRK